MIPKFALITLITLLLAACAQPATPAPTPTNPPAAVPTNTPDPTPVPSVSLTYQDNAQVELVTSTGRHIYIDVANPASLTKAPDANDVLLTTHLHGDHYYASFQSSFPGQQLFVQEGTIELPDVTITGMASAHNTNDPIQSVNATNYIYILDVAGLRIAHFGDIGQAALTDSQLAALGTVDVAISQTANSFSSMDAANLKGFNLMDQVQPRLIIPTHTDQATMKIASEKWKGYYSQERTITLSKDTLPMQTSFISLGNLAIAYGALFKLEPWK